MRVTIDIPDAEHRKLKIKAASEGKTMRELVLSGIDALLASQDAPRKGKLKFPLVKSKRPGSLKLGKEGVYKYIPFP